jgi:hypothetical protein
MNYPFCGAEMVTGTLRNSRQCINCFLPEGKRAYWFTDAEFKKIGAVKLPPSQYDPFFKPHWAVAHCCEACRRVILEY